MATIYSKQPASGNNCLVLDIREEMVQPFQFNPSWTEIRLGMFYSFTSATGFNDLYIPESLSYTSETNGFYYGIINSGYFPFETGALYIGINTSPAINSGSSSLSAGVLNGYSNNLYPMIGSGSGSSYSGSFTGIFPASPSFSSGSTGFASFLGLRIEVTGAGATGQSIRMSLANGNSGVGTDNTTVSFLRSVLSGFQNSSELSPYMFFTSGFSSQGGPLPLPDNFFIYSPFFNNRLRLHTILVQRYQPIDASN